MANDLVKFVLKCVNILQSRRVRFTIENPRYSYLWHLDPVAKLVKGPDTQMVHIDMCQMGSPWRKATSFLAWDFPEATHLAVQCAPKRGICSRSGRRHLHLHGRDAEGRWITARAQEYPPCLARDYSLALTQGMLNRHLSSSMKLVRPALPARTLVDSGLDDEH